MEYELRRQQQRYNYVCLNGLRPQWKIRWYFDISVRFSWSISEIIFIMFLIRFLKDNSTQILLHSTMNHNVSLVNKPQKCQSLMCKSCQFDRASNDKFSVNVCFDFFQPALKSDLKEFQFYSVKVISIELRHPWNTLKGPKISKLSRG